MSEQTNKGFWTDQARQHSGGSQAVTFDQLAETLEIEALIPQVRGAGRVLDLGCGNGRTLLALAEIFPDISFTGVDFIPEMIAAARNLQKEKALPNVVFLTRDAVADDVIESFEEPFDLVVAKRLLINLHGDLKYRAIRNIYSVLKPGGRYLMIECFLEPLERINAARAAIGLEAVRVHDFNEYMPLSFRHTISPWFTFETEVDFLSLYYFVSRVINAGLSEGKPDYFAPVNRLAVDLSLAGITPMAGYAPEIMLSFRRKEAT